LSGGAHFDRIDPLKTLNNKALAAGVKMQSNRQSLERVLAELEARAKTERVFGKIYAETADLWTVGLYRSRIYSM
jgi:hypothetical protein